MNPKRKFFSVIAFLVLVLLGALGWLYLQKPIAATVGETDIYLADAQARDRIVRLYFPEEKRAMGLFQLIKSAYHIEILKNNGVNFTPEQILQEEERIIKNSKNPDLLKQIREAFGEDHEAYLRVFVLPTLADRFIYFDFFLNDPGIHSESLAQARSFLEALQKSDKINFRATALQLGWEPVSLVLRPNEEFAHGSAADVQVWRDKIISHLLPGQVFPEPISISDSWAVIHLQRQIQDREFQLEIVYFRKSSFPAWLKKEKQKISLKIKDPKSLPDIPL
jgi:hypothetical protein